MTQESTVAAVPHADGSARRRVVTGAIVGGVMEWFDYFIYATAAALVFPTLFFAGTDPVTAIIVSFGSFAVGQFARPVGAIVLGNLGDRIGRRPILIITFSLMGGSTFLMGLLPTYQQVGALAPVLLIILRVAQGFGAGAEYAGATAMMIEYAPKNRRGLYGSVGVIGSSGGLTLGTLVFWLLQLMPEDQFHAWGWRLPFLASIALVAVGFWIRSRVDETPHFQRVLEEKKVERMPLAQVLKEDWRALLLVFLLTASVLMGSFIFLTWSLSYMRDTVGIPGSSATFIVFLAGLVATIGGPIWGLLSDHIGRKKVFAGGALLCALLVFPFFWMVNTGNLFLAGLAVILEGGIALQFMSGVQGSLFSELFPTRQRLSGFAIGREISAAIFGGLSPVIATALVAASGGQSWSVSIYLIIVFVVTFVATLLARETHKDELKV